MPAPIVWNRKPLPPNQYAPLPESAIRPQGWLLQKPRANVAAQSVERWLKADTLPGGEAIRGLMRHYRNTVDIRVLQYLMKVSKELHDSLREKQMDDAKQAACVGDLMHMALWLYNLTGQPALLSLCKRLKAQAPDWASSLHIFPYQQPVGGKDASGDAYWRAHGTIIASSLKTPGLQALFEGGAKNETAFRVGWEKLTRYHGAAHGLFNADPLLAGSNPSRGVSGSTVLEMLYTLSVLLWAQGDPFCGDLLESIVLNALPVAGGLQSANQLTGRPGKSVEAEGMSLYTSTLWMATSDDGLAAISYAPCEVRWRVGGGLVRVVVDTTYPAEESVRISVHCQQPVTFPLHLRIPAWAKGATVRVNEEEPLACVDGGFTVLRREWRPGDRLLLILPMEPTLAQCARQSASVQYGPLIFALPVEADTPWNVALVSGFPLEQRAEAGSVAVYAHVAPVGAWTVRAKVPGPLPILPAVDLAAAYQARLVPYGETQARIAQFPVSANGKAVEG